MDILQQNLKPTQISVHNPLFGPRNLGHYLGSMKDLIATQHYYRTVVVIDDIAATFINPRDFKSVQNRSFFIVQDFINAGFDHKNNSIILTSQVIQELTQLIFYFSSVVDLKYCNHLFQNSFIGGLKAHQRKGMELKQYPSIFEQLYPQLGMPSISLGLDVELFQGGEEIMGYTYIMKEIVDGVNNMLNLDLYSPIYEPSRNRTVLGLDGQYMFQHNSIFLAEDEQSIRDKIFQIKNKDVLMDWYKSFGYPDIASNLFHKENFMLEKEHLTDLLIEEFKPFRRNKLTNQTIIEVLSTSAVNVKQQLNKKLEELKQAFQIPILK